MASAWITRRPTASGRSRYRVMYRLGGRESMPRYAGSFSTKREALTRKSWVLGELAALRVPDVRLVDERASSPALSEVAERWQTSRVDVAAGTLQTYRVALGRVLPRFGNRPIAGIDAQTVADLVAELHGKGLKKQTIRKTVSVLAMVLDHASVQPNPARDRLTVKLPREERRHVQPPTAEHVEAVVRLLPKRYRLPALILDATGMRIGDRRVSLLHLGGMPWARIGELVGHDDLVTTARTYTHVVADERELDYSELLV